MGMVSFWFTIIGVAKITRRFVHRYNCILTRPQGKQNLVVSIPISRTPPILQNCRTCPALSRPTYNVLSVLVMHHHIHILPVLPWSTFHFSITMCSKGSNDALDVRMVFEVIGLLFP